MFASTDVDVVTAIAVGGRAGGGGGVDADVTAVGGKAGGAGGGVDVIAVGGRAVVVLLVASTSPSPQSERQLVVLLVVDRADRTGGGADVTAVGGRAGGGAAAGGGVDADDTAVAGTAGGGDVDVTAIAGTAGGGGVDVTAVGGRAGEGGVDADVIEVAGGSGGSAGGGADVTPVQGRNVGAAVGGVDVTAVAGRAGGGADVAAVGGRAGATVISDVNVVVSGTVLVIEVVGCAPLATTDGEVSLGPTPSGSSAAISGRGGREEEGGRRWEGSLVPGCGRRDTEKFGRRPKCYFIRSRFFSITQNQNIYCPSTSLQEHFSCGAQ